MRESDRFAQSEVIDLFDRTPRYGSRCQTTPYACLDDPGEPEPGSDPRGFRLRVEVGRRDECPVWRELVVRGDLTCDRLHMAIGAAFDREEESYRYRLYLGPDLRAPRLLCPWEGQFVGLAGTIQSDVRLDQLVRRAGDELCHVQEFGYEELVEVSAIRVLEVVDTPRFPVELVDGAKVEYAHGRGSDAFDLAQARARVRAIDQIESFPWRFSGVARWLLRDSATAQCLMADLDEGAAGPAPEDLASATVPWVTVLHALAPGAEVDEQKQLASPMLTEITTALPAPGPTTAPAARLVSTAVAAGLAKIQRRRIELTRAGEAVTTDASALLPHLARRLALGRSQRDRHTGWMTVLIAAAGAPPEGYRFRTADLLTELRPPSRFRRAAPEPDPASPTLDALEILGGMWFPGHGTPAVAQHVARRALGVA